MAGINIIRLTFLCTVHLMISPLCVYAWNLSATGSNNCGLMPPENCTGGQLGLNDRQNRASFSQVESIGNIVLAAAGNHHSVVLAVGQDGVSVFVAGDNRFGQLGLGSQFLGEQQRFTRLPLAQVNWVECGGDFTLAAVQSTDGGKILSWGRNDRGQLGLRDYRDRNEPDEISLPHVSHASLVEISAGKSHAGVITAGGDVITWGYNLWGQLGTGDRENRPAPTLVDSGSSSVAVKIAQGQDHTVVVYADGSVQGCGGAEVYGFAASCF